MEVQYSRDVTPLPSLANTLPASAQSNKITLPDLKTALSHDFDTLDAYNARHQSEASPASVHALPRINPGPPYHPLDSGIASPTATGSVMSVDDRVGGANGMMSAEDESVLIAAQALSGLGDPKNFGRRNEITQPPSYGHRITHAQLPHGEPEPILELIAQAHPWVGTTIKGGISAYSTTKNFSPRIVQYGVNLVEKNIAFPIANAVGSVGEFTGAEYVARRYLDPRRPNDVEHGRQTDMQGDVAMDTDNRTDYRRLSIDSLTEPLPVYGSTRPPSYREEQSPASTDRSQMQSRQRPTRSWSSQLLVTTSGLSVALSTTSRDSLRFCLSLLGTSAVRVSDLTQALKSILEQYEERRRNWQQGSDLNVEKGERPRTPEQDDAARQLADQIKAQSENIMRTLQHVVNNISNYAGGALPDNARQFVRTQLMSLPQRWRVVSSEQHAGDSETSKSAQRMIGFAKEGLDMITQVSNVMKATLDSAEQWLARVGRRDQAQQGDQTMRDAEPTYPPQAYGYEVEKS